MKRDASVEGPPSWALYARSRTAPPLLGTEGSGQDLQTSERRGPAANLHSKLPLLCMQDCLRSLQGLVQTENLGPLIQK